MYVKRIIAFMISLIMCIISAVPTALAQTEEINLSYIFNENFDRLSAGAYAASNVSVQQKTNTIAVADDGDGGKELKFTAITTSDFHLDITTGSNQKAIIIEFDLEFEHESNSLFSLFFKNSSGVENRIFRFDGQGNLYTPSGALICSVVMGKSYKFAVKLSPITGLADIWINGKEKARGIAIGDKKFGNVGMVRFHSAGITGEPFPVIYMDNIAIYESEMPVFKYEILGKKVVFDSDSGVAVADVASMNEVEDYMEGASAIYVGQPKLFSGGEIQYIDSDNKNAAPYIKNDRAMVPLRAVAESLEAEVLWEEAERKVMVDTGTKTVTLTIDSETMITEGNTITLDAPPEIKDGRTYVPIRAISEALDKKVFYDQSGLIVISDRENFFNFRSDLGIFRALCGELVFHNPTGAEMAEMIKERYPNNGHPRIYADKAKIEELRERIKTDANVSKWFADVVVSTESIFNDDPVVYDIYDGIRLLMICRKARDRMQKLAFCYQMTGDTRYADRCITELRAVCNFKDWNPYHFLDPAEMMEAVAFAYDWLYDYMEPSFRETVKTALVEKGLKQVLEDYRNTPGRSRSYRWAQSAVPDNWNVVCNSGSLQAAFVLADEVPDIAIEVMDNGMELIKKAILMYAPDGAWFEGIVYWQYTTNYYTDLMSALDSCFGDTFGYTDTPGVARTGNYLAAMTGFDGFFNFHDASETSNEIDSSVLHFLAEKLNDPGLTWLRMNQMESLNLTGKWRDILWYNPELMGSGEDMETDFYFRDTEAVSMRSGWNKDRDVYVGFHSGKTNVYHGHMDAGSFVIDAYGMRYVCDVGPEDYNIKDSVWNLYRYRAEGHNTLVINPGTDGGQLVSGVAKIDRFDSNDYSAYTITDLTNMYETSSTSVKRGLKVTNNKSAIIVQDEVHNKEESDVWWFMHTKYDIEVAEDGKSAVIKCPAKNGNFRNMYVSLMQDTPGEFFAMDATPLETSPKNDSQNKNKAYKKLVFRAQGVKDITIPILMQFGVPIEGYEPDFKADVVPLDKWTLDSGESYQTPKLSSISINGNPIADFDKDVYTYSYEMKYDEAMPVITAEGDGKITVKTVDQIPVRSVITITNNEGISEHYVVTIHKEKLKVIPEGTQQLTVADISASDVPQPENSPPNAIDGNLDTRWSATGIADLTVDLGSVKAVQAFGIAVYQDTTIDGRRQFFEVHVSEDGENFTNVFDGETSGTTLEEELFEITRSKARYIRFRCKETSVGEWNSITELSIYGQ